MALATYTDPNDPNKPKPAFAKGTGTAIINAYAGGNVGGTNESNPTGQINPGGAGSNAAMMAYYQQNPQMAPQTPTTQTAPVMSAASRGPTGADMNTARANTIASQTIHGNPQPGTQPITGGNGTFTTDVGKTAADKLNQYLTTGDPLAKAAQANEDTAASRRAYVARLQTDQQLGQTHFAPGTAQYNRALNESRAGVDIANQQGRANVNQYTRERTQDLLGQAKDLESTQYGRVKDTTNSLLAQIPNPKAKTAFMRLVAGGMDPNQAFQQSITETGETVVKPQTPEADRRLAAGATVTAQNPALKPGTPEYEAAVDASIKAEEDTKQETIRLAKEKADTDEARKILISDGTPTGPQLTLLEKSGDIPVFAKLSDLSDPTKVGNAKMVKVGNAYYKVGRTESKKAGTSAPSQLANQDMVIDANGNIVKVYITDAQGNEYFINGGKLYPVKKK